MTCNEKKLRSQENQNFFKSLDLSQHKNNPATFHHDLKNRTSINISQYWRSIHINTSIDIPYVNRPNFIFALKFLQYIIVKTKSLQS